MEGYVQKHKETGKYLTKENVMLEGKAYIKYDWTENINRAYYGNEILESTRCVSDTVKVQILVTIAEY